MDISLLGNNLRLARIKRGYSQEQAAELCGISEKTMGKIERAQANITLETLGRIEEGMSLSLADLIAEPSETSGLIGKVSYFAVLEQGTDVQYPYTYGMMVCRNTKSGYSLVSIVHDISVDADFVLNMVRDFNSYQLSPAHLLDAIVDRLP